MCLGMPLKIIKINGNDAIGEIRGISRNIRIDFLPAVKTGDYVMVHAGFAIELMDMEAANETADLFSEIEDLVWKK